MNTNINVKLKIDLNTLEIYFGDNFLGKAYLN